MAKVPCKSVASLLLLSRIKHLELMGSLIRPRRYFTRSSPERRFCPYGDDCFYKHEDVNGQPYKFSSGVDTLLPAYKARKARIRRERLRQQRLREILDSRRARHADDDDDDGSHDPLDLFATDDSDASDVAAALEYIRAGGSPTRALTTIYADRDHDHDEDGDDDEEDYEDEDGEDSEAYYDWGLTLEDLVEDLVRTNHRFEIYEDTDTYCTCACEVLSRFLKDASTDSFLVGFP